jgi:photosystem II stability/assembly factor-like uncharacterized protein
MDCRRRRARPVNYRRRCGNTWASQPSGTSRALLGLAALPKVVIVVGEGGTILRSEGGSEWKQVESATALTLNAIAVSGKIACAVGAQGTLVESTDEGLSWKTVTASSPRDLNSIDLPDPKHGVAVGQRGSSNTAASMTLEGLVESSTTNSRK